MKRLLHKAPTSREDQPLPDWVVCTCPACGGKAVSNSYYVGGRGYFLVWECWNSLGHPKGQAPCNWRRVL